MRELCEIDVLHDERLRQGIARRGLAMLVAGLLAAFLLAALGVRDELGPLAWAALLLASLGLALPVHELIHAAAFRLLGGPSVHARP